MEKKWHNLVIFKMKKVVIRWKGWRTRHDSNVRPSVPQTVLVGIQGQSAPIKDNNISTLIALYYCHISPNMACFCKLMAQKWHKKHPHIRVP